MNVRHAISTFRGNRVPNFQIIKHRNWWFALSGFFIVLSLIGLFGRGLNRSIAFTGGAQLTYTAKTVPSVADVQGILGQYGRSADSEVEIIGNDQVNIRTGTLTTLGTQAQDLREALAKQAGINVDEISEQDVGPSWGSQISRKALEGLIVFLVLVSIYISFRFEPKMAISALVALAHDLIITAGIYALVGRQVTPETIIAILTILGYSLYDTVVIFDKIKENSGMTAMVARETYSGMVNMSLNQTLMRSLNTSLVVLLPIGSLLLFGGTTLKDFAFALFIGVAAGTYSSIFIAAPLLAVLKEREPRYQMIKTKADVRTTRAGLRSVSSADGEEDMAEDEELATASAVAGSGQTRPSGSGGSSSRPRPSSSSRNRKKRPQGKPKRRRR
jgi:preprotein translocase subunit SecF